MELPRKRTFLKKGTEKIARGPLNLLLESFSSYMKGRQSQLTDLLIAENSDRSYYAAFYNA